MRSLNLTRSCNCPLQHAHTHSEPTLPQAFRSVIPNVDGGKYDVFRTSPWRSPGAAPVYGSGCGASGGGPVAYANGGTAAAGTNKTVSPQGFDGKNLPAQKPVVWKRGTTAQVAWAISANHGGKLRCC